MPWLCQICELKPRAVFGGSVTRRRRPRGWTVESILRVCGVGPASVPRVRRITAQFIDGAIRAWFRRLSILSSEARSPGKSRCQGCLRKSRTILLMLTSVQYFPTLLPVSFYWSFYWRSPVVNQVRFLLAGLDFLVHIHSFGAPLMEDSVAQQRLQMLLLSTFAGDALPKRSGSGLCSLGKAKRPRFVKDSGFLSVYT